MKPPFQNPPRRATTPTAFTLIEVMITLGIATMFVMGVIIFTTVTFRQGIFAIGNYTDLNTKSRRTLDTMSRDIRSAAGLNMIYYSPYNINLTNTDGTHINYVWDGVNTLTRYKDTKTSLNNFKATVLLTNCDYLRFNLYQRNPTNNYSFVSAEAIPSQTKLIDVSWRCSRKYMGQKLNTESVQTARIVIRN